MREENAAAALEVMSRFAIDPRWLVYLPPTMAPDRDLAAGPTSSSTPSEAFAEYRVDGVPHVICEEKHMGSRAIVVVCRDADVARGALRRRQRRDRRDLHAHRPPVPRRARPIREAALSRVRAAVESRRPVGRARRRTGCVLDCELLPWSAKAMELIRRQYAAVGAAAAGGPRRPAVATLEQAAARGLDVAALLESQRQRIEHVDHYVDAYRRYVWPVNGVADLRLAPFHVLAAETGVFIDRDHTLAPRASATGSSPPTPSGFSHDRPSARSTSPTPKTRPPASPGGRS